MHANTYVHAYTSDKLQTWVCCSDVCEQGHDQSSGDDHVDVDYQLTGK